MLRTTTYLATAGFAIALALAACGRSSTSPDVSRHVGSFNLRDGAVVISAAAAPEARVASDGRLTIDGRDVAVSDAQRAALVRYYDAATGVLQSAMATGAAGAEVGQAAASGVAAGLAKGDVSDLKAKVEAQAEDVRRQATKICESLAEVRAAQDALAAQLPAFGPYTVVSAEETASCAESLQQRPAR
jgi:Protein of unknown function (DUF2884)